MATNTWFVMIPPGYATQSTAAKQKVDFRIQYPAGSQAWADANAGKILSPSESTMGQQLVKWQGPFATEAQAQAAQNPTQQSANPVNDATFAVQTANIPAITGLNQFFTEVEGFFKFTEKVVEDLVDPKFWASLGWLFLGLILTISGLVMWLKHEGVSMPHLPKVVPLPV